MLQHLISCISCERWSCTCFYEWISLVTRTVVIYFSRLSRNLDTQTHKEEFHNTGVRNTDSGWYGARWTL